MFRGLVAVAVLGAFGMFLTHPETRRIGRQQWRQHLGHGECMQARRWTVHAGMTMDRITHMASIV